MKFRIIVLISLTAILSACNLTLAEDVTPPPDFIPPTPIPTLVLVPPQTPNLANGEVIYFEKCAACHGNTGLGDGAQGIQLGVTVPAFALPEIARPASPAGWYTIVTRGNIDRFMPPFVSLNDQERWDVVAYIMSLHTSKDEIRKGREVFDVNCQNCSTDFYKDQSKMSPLSTVALARIVRLGNDEIQAFGEDLTDDEMWAVAEYLRSLSYDTMSPAQLPDKALDKPTPDISSRTPIPVDGEPTSVDGTPVGTQPTEAINEASPPSIDGIGSISGTIENKTGEDLPLDLIVTLRGFEHDYQDPNAGTQEVVTVDGIVEKDGSFTFENVEIAEGRIFLAEVTYKEIEISSDFIIAGNGQTFINLPPLVLHGVTQDTSGLVIDDLDIFLTSTTEGKYEVLALYSFRNTGKSVVYVEMKDSQEIPFLKFPVGAQAIGYEALQDSAPFTSTIDGFAMAPSETPYGIIAFSSIVTENDVAISLPLILPVSVVRIYVPDGMKAAGDQLAPDNPQDIQGDLYQTYIANGLEAGDILSFTVSGSSQIGSTPTESTTPSSTLLIGAGGLGISLLLAGAWMYLRDKTQQDEVDDNENDFDSAEDVMDMIIALDDLHRAKKIADESYQKRRAELKEDLKELL